MVVSSSVGPGGEVGLHDSVAVAIGLLLLLQWLDVDVKFFDFLPDGSNSSG